MKIRVKNLAIINLFDLQILLVYLIFLKPAIIDDSAILDLIWNALRFGLTVLYSFLFLAKKKKMSIGWYLLLFAFIAVLTSTILQAGQIGVVLGHFVPILGLVAWIELNKEHLDRIFKIFLIVGGVLIFINLVTIILFPDGVLKRNIYMPVWLLGQKQEFINSAFGVIVFAGICGYKKLVSKKLILGVLLALAVSFFYLKPIGPLIACIVILIVFAVEKITKRYFGNVFLFVISVVGELIVLVLAYGYEKMTWLQFFLAGVSTSGMSKDTTMGNRVAMWEYASEMFLESPIIGAGQVTKEVWYQTSSLPYYHSIVHNMYLDFAFTGGIIALGFFIALNISAVRKLQKYSDSKEARFIGICFFSLNILHLVECLYSPMVLLIYFLPDWLAMIKSKDDRRLLNDKGSFE